MRDRQGAEQHCMETRPIARVSIPHRDIAIARIIEGTGCTLGGVDDDNCVLLYSPGDEAFAAANLLRANGFKVTLALRKQA